MRLLFIYFYIEKGTFKEKTIIEFSKKYKIKDNENFNFTLIKNSSFQDKFYGNNIDIGAIIGENGRGKSILINSLRDKNNNYSFTVYEKFNKLFYHGKLDKKIIINNQEVCSPENMSFIYYSPIIDMFNANINNEWNISDKQLLLNNDAIPLSNRLAIIENNDINSYFQMDDTRTTKNYLEIKQIKLKPLNDFFEQITMYILKRIQLEDIGKIDLKPNLSVINFFSEIIDELSNNTINEYFDKIEDFENLEYILVNSKELLTNYARVVSQNISMIAGYSDELKKDIKYFIGDRFIDELLSIYLIDPTNIEENVSNFSKKLEQIYLDYYQNNQNNYHPILTSDYFIYKKIIDIIKIKSKNNMDSRHKNFIAQLSCSMYKVLAKKYNTRIKIADMKITEMSHKKEILRFHYSSINNYSKHINNEVKKKILYKYLKDFREELLTKKIIPELSKYLYILGFESEVKELKEYDKLRLYAYLMFFYEKIEENIRLKIGDILNLDNDIYGNIIMETINKSNNLMVYIDEKNKKIFKEYNKFLLDKKEIPFFTYELNPPLSSGQKAILFIFARIDNAIKQINDEKRNNHIVILLDEADLKLHLEWQRLFINDLINFLKNNYKNQKIYILYATHSPMILSDITDDRIVFLEKKDNGKYSQELEKNRRKRTFGANIYDLYSDSFLVKDSIGAFTSSKINEIIDFFYKVQKSEDDKLKELKNEYEKKRKQFRFVQENIGEEFISNIIENHIEDIEKRLKLKTHKEKQIDKLKNELRRLGVEINVKN